MNVPSSKSGISNSSQAQLKSPPKPLPRTVFTKLENKPKNVKDKDSKKNSDESTKSSLNNKYPQNNRKNYPSQTSSASKESTKLNTNNKEKDNDQFPVQPNQKCYSKKSQSRQDQHTNTTKCNSKKELKLETKSTSSSSTSIASSIDSTRKKDEKHTKGDSKLSVGNTPPKDDASKTNATSLTSNGLPAKTIVSSEGTLTENRDVPNSPVLLSNNNDGSLTGGPSKSKNHQTKRTSSRPETSKRPTNKLYPSISVSTSSSENESPPFIPSKAKCSNKSGTVDVSLQTVNGTRNTSNQILSTPIDLTTNNSSHSDLNMTEACSNIRRNAFSSNDPSTSSDSFITSPTSNNKTAFKFPSSISSLSHKLGIGPLKKYTKYNMNSKKHSKRSPTSPSSPDYTEENLRNDGRNPVPVESSDSHRFQSTGAVSRRNNARTNINNRDSAGAGNSSRITNSSNYASRQDSSDSRYQESRRSAPNQVNDRATRAVSSRNRTRPENQSTPSSSRDTRGQSSQRTQNNERNDQSNNGQAAFSTSLLGATSFPTSLPQNNSSKNKLKVPLKNLEDFRNVYDRVTSSLKIGRDLILCGNYSQASREFEAGLRLMDRILETSVAQLKLSTLDDALCKSIQDVVSSNRKTALEGYSDAQAGILHPKDIPQAFPEGAPPSYTEVLKEDLHNSFAGYGTSSRYHQEESSFLPSASSSALCLQSRGNHSDPKDFLPGSSDDVLPSRKSPFRRESSLNENVISINANRHTNFHFSPYTRQPSAPQFLEEDLILINPVPIPDTAESVANVETNTSYSDLLGQNVNVQESLLLDLLPTSSDPSLNYSKVTSGNILTPINQNTDGPLGYASYSEAIHSSYMNDMAAADSFLNSVGSGMSVETKETISEKMNSGDRTTEDKTPFNGKISFNHASKQEFLPTTSSEVSSKTCSINKLNCSAYEPNSTKIESSSKSQSENMNGINLSSCNLLPETITLSTGSTITSFPISDTADSLPGTPNSNFPQSSSVAPNGEKTNAIVHDSRVHSLSLNSPVNLETRLLPPSISSFTHLEVPETSLPKRNIIFPPDVCLSSVKSRKDSDVQSNSAILSSSSGNIIIAPTVVSEQKENLGGAFNLQDEQKDFPLSPQMTILNNGLRDAPASKKSSDEECEAKSEAIIRKPSLEKINTPIFEHDINASVVIPNKRNIRKYSEENIYENVETIRNYLSTDSNDRMLKDCNSYSKTSSSTESKITIQLNNDQKYIPRVHDDTKKHPHSLNKTDYLEVIPNVTSPSSKGFKPKNSNSEPQTWNDDHNTLLNPNQHEKFSVNDDAKENKTPFSRSFSSSNLSMNSMRVMSPSPSYQYDRLSSCVHSSSSSTEKINSEEGNKSSNDYVLLRENYLYASTKSTTKVELRNKGSSHYLPMSGKIFRKSLSTEDILSKYENFNPTLSHSPQRKSVLSEFDPLKSNNYSSTPENTFEEVQNVQDTSDSDADPRADFVNEKTLQIKMTEGKFRINTEEDSSKSTNETTPCSTGDIKKEDAISEDTISVQGKKVHSRTCSVNSSGVSHSPEEGPKTISYPPLTEIFPQTELQTEFTTPTQDAFTRFETGLKRGIKSLSSLALSSPTKSQRQKKMSEGSFTFGQSEFYASINTPQPLQSPNNRQTKERGMSNKKWKQVMKISDVKLYFIKREDSLVSTYAVRPTLLVLEQDLSHSTDKVNKPNARITAELASDTIWSRDLTYRTVVVFQTVSEAFIFSEFEGVFVGLTLSSKTSYSKMSKFSNFLKVNTFFEKEMLLKSATKQPSKVLKIIDDLIGERGGQIRKDVTRKSLRGVKFARTTISNLKDQPLSPKVYEHPNTKNVFGDMGTLQAVGRILEKSIFENSMNIF